MSDRLKNARVEDLTNYPERTYHYSDGGELTIKDCRELHIVARSDGNGYSHRVITRVKGSRTQRVFFVPAGWVAVSWPVSDGNKLMTF